MDFIIPLSNNNILFRATIESIIELHNPRHIFIILPNIYITELTLNSKTWILNNTLLIFLDEETFFIKNYNLSFIDIQKMYKYIDSKSREFGWWYQQILKLGAVYQIENLSDPFIIWDSDLIVFNKWSLDDNLFAILQYKSRNEFNTIEYNNVIKYLLDVENITPLKGTFIPHHYVFHHKIIKHFLDYITERTKSNNWIECIMLLSHKYYRFSEYKTLTTFIYYFYNDKFNYHEYNKFGKNGKRFRNNKKIISIIKKICIIENNTISYNEIKKINEYINNISYLQIEHL